VVQVNPAAEHLLGVAPGELTGKSFADILPPDELEAAMELYARVISGRPQEYEMDLLSLKGECRSIRGVSVPVVVDGEVTGVFGVALGVE
jgi:PAS domain S-box-containing protein